MATVFKIRVTRYIDEKGRQVKKGIPGCSRKTNQEQEVVRAVQGRIRHASKGRTVDGQGSGTNPAQ